MNEEKLVAMSEEQDEPLTEVRGSRINAFPGLSPLILTISLTSRNPYLLHSTDEELSLSETMEAAQVKLLAGWKARI